MIRSGTSAAALVGSERQAVRQSNLSVSRDAQLNSGLGAVRTNSPDRAQTTRTMRLIQVGLLGLAICFNAAGVAAEPMILDVVFSPKNEIRLDFKDDNRHFVILTEREGSAAGGGMFSGAKVVEYGMHDVIRGEGGKASGYLEAITNGGDIAYFRWRLRALFVAGPDGKTKVIDNGYWELTGGTGQFASMRGVGTLLLEFVSKTDRRYLLKGDISPAP